MLRGRDRFLSCPVDLGLHTHEKALPDEAASVSRLGMEYIHIPVDFQNPTEQDFQQFCAVMEQLEGVPVHVHCIANARVSAFFSFIRKLLVINIHFGLIFGYILDISTRHLITQALC